MKTGNTATTKEEVRAGGVAYLQAKIKAEQRSVIKRQGVKYSPLHDLTYFKPVQQTVIDPMHNLFLGVAKNTTKIWLRQAIRV
jgi:hypothetical protein